MDAVCMRLCLPLVQVVFSVRALLRSNGTGNMTCCHCHDVRDRGVMMTKRLIHSTT
jgi:hypothetical protein